MENLARATSRSRPTAPASDQVKNTDDRTFLPMARTRRDLCWRGCPREAGL